MLPPLKYFSIHFRHFFFHFSFFRHFSLIIEGTKFVLMIFVWYITLDKIKKYIRKFGGGGGTSQTWLMGALSECLENLSNALKTVRVLLILNSCIRYDLGIWDRLKRFHVMFPILAARSPQPKANKCLEIQLWSDYILTGSYRPEGDCVSVYRYLCFLSSERVHLFHVYGRSNCDRSKLSPIQSNRLYQKLPIQQWYRCVVEEYLIWWYRL